jgi:hypothetical protein
MGLSQLSISIVLIGLFTIAIVGFAISFAIDNNAVFSIADDPEMSTLNSNTKVNMSDFGKNASSQYSSILNTTISPGSDVPQSAAPFAITPWSLVQVITNIVFVAYTKIFGTGSGFGIFFTTFIAVIVFLFGFFIYKALRGLPD